MGKKVPARKKSLPKSASNRKNVRHYLQMYTLAVIVGAIVYIAGIFIFNPVSPCANTGSCKSDLSMEIDNNTLGTFGGQKFVPPTIDPAHDSKAPAVLGTSTSEGEKHIYVDLSSQQLYAYEGKNQIFQTYIASGKWNPTPVGNFHIWEKLRATRMKGGEGADAYDLPNVPYVMYFFQDFGIHGAYWHNNFGHMMSHGCVNMRIDDAHTLYDWADGPSGNTPGTAVSVCKSFTGPDNCVQ